MFLFSLAFSIGLTATALPRAGSLTDSLRSTGEFSQRCGIEINLPVPFYPELKSMYQEYGVQVYVSPEDVLRLALEAAGRCRSQVLFKQAPKKPRPVRPVSPSME